MKTEVKRQRRGEGGFTLMELMIVFLIVAILAVVLVLLSTGVFGGAHKSAMATDLHTAGIAVDDYYLQSLGKSPTVDGSLPPEGQYSLIDFNASFTDGAKTYYFKDLLKKLPRHYKEGVWRIDSKGDVSVDVDPKDY
jgi:type II secretory pathway pseudopilin PulG